MYKYCEEIKKYLNTPINFYKNTKGEELSPVNYIEYIKNKPQPQPSKVKTTKFGKKKMIIDKDIKYLKK